MLSAFANEKFYAGNHRVVRVLSFFSIVVGIGTSPTPHPQASVPPLPPVLGGGAHSLAREGLGEFQFRQGDIHCGALYIYVLCAGNIFNAIEAGNTTEP